MGEGVPVAFQLPPLATPAEVAKRVQETPTDQVDIDLIAVLLDIVSADVRSYGSWPDPILAPDVVKAIVIKAAARGYMNAGGYQLERGDMLTLQRSDLFAEGESLSVAEIRALQRAAGTTGSVVSVPAQRDVVPSDSTGSGGGGDSEIAY